MYIWPTEWTVALTKYLHNCATKLWSKSKSVSELLLLLKPANEESSMGDHGNMADSMDTSEDGRKASVSGAPPEVSEATKWTYCCRLVNWLYHVSMGIWNVNCELVVSCEYGNMECELVLSCEYRNIECEL